MAKGIQHENGKWKQPVTFIPVATDKRGHFQRLPEIAWLQTVAEHFGANAANMALDAMRQFALRAAQARAKAKGVADTVEAERDAASKCLDEIAGGTYKSRDTDPNNAIKTRPEFLAELRAHLEKKHPNVTEAQVEATAAAHGDTFLEAVGDELTATITYAPTKKSAKAESEALSI